MILRVARKLAGSGVKIVPFATAVMTLKTPTVRFHNGIEFPLLGLGTWKVSYLFSALILRIVM
jgi:hypothetical protein